MEHNDREYTDMLNDELKDIEPGAGLHDKVREGIARNVVRMRRRNTAFGAVAIAIIITMALSTAMPVFGRNGTLPQVIAAMAAERQAGKMSKTLGTAPVQQTGAALQMSGATVQTVSDSALSETDAILALVIADQSDTLVDVVLKLRATGLGWGRIMAQLNVSGRDIGKAMSQAETVAVASSPSAASQGQGATSKPAVGNTDGNKIVVSGEITGVSSTSITVAGKSFVLATATQLKYQGKAITTTQISAKLLAGKLYATVQGTKQVGTSILANLIIVQNGADSEHANPSNEQANPSNEQAAVSNDQQVRGKVRTRTSTTLHIEGFDSDIILNADTKVEQVGAGNLDITAIKVGQTVQVHVSLTGTTYMATQVHIEDKYVKPDKTTDPSVKTWQGTIANVIVQQTVNSANEQTIGFVVLAESGQPTFYWVLPTSVLQDASHHTLTLAALQTLQSIAVQKVTIEGRLLANGTVDIVKLTVATVNTTTTPEPTNPGKGKGNGKH
jgi:hypothetical protein